MHVKLKWNEEKNELLKATRKVSFEMVQNEVNKGKYTKPIINPAHPENQFIFVVSLNGYPHVVPFVIEDNDTWFLKTIIPNRKYKGKI
ncbi:MAG: toxin [Candidatus Riflebacteria bacterium]|nr:toxin [Candidatus Riflebacteria bacterium]